MQVSILIVVFGLVMGVVGKEATYKAAVVEFSPDQTTIDITKRIQNNLNGFEKILKSIQNENVQIIVFPEDGICGLTGIPKESLDEYFEKIPGVYGIDDPNPCLQSSFDDRPVLQSLSCLARRYKVVLVANLGDKQPCDHFTQPNCPSTNVNFYNTDVVFERDGTLIAKYHKVNLYDGEKLFYTAGNSTSGVSFQTNFGVTFGIFTCFDILFHNPGDCLVKAGVKNFVFPTAWSNSFPFYMATVVQQGWSYRNGANFLAANLHVSFPTSTFYGTGSGLYSAGVAKQYLLTGNDMLPATGKVLISDLPVDPMKLEDRNQSGIVTDIPDIRARFSRYATFKTLDIGSHMVKASSTYNGTELTCSLDYTMGKTLETYALGAYIGNEQNALTRQTLGKVWSVKRRGIFTFAVCFVTKCNEDLGCGHIALESDTVFQSFSLNGDFPPGSKVYPSAFSSNYTLISPDVAVCNNEWDGLSMKSPGNLISAGLWTMVDYPASVCKP